ncbi:phosphatase PAP2 family protein [Psychromonas sp. SP041]|uniref:phosphatase PAP2 family protein n=1 Tax=Psychromonas sp. SP041 TaxID=1365007 RepID=UPI000425C467|nr:phosphatase PAP2 family protein [Psychromonas sp. SP041]
MNALKNLTKTCLIVASLSASTTAIAENDDRTWMTDAGDNLQYAVPVFAAGYALYKGDWDGFWQTAEGAVYTSLATHALKYSVSEERPNGMDDNSFPSGHTSAAMQGAAFLSMRYGWEVGVPATVVASFVGYSRVEAKYHYTRDVLAGTAIAWGVQYAITELGFSPTEFIISPFVDNTNGFGVHVSGKF